MAKARFYALNVNSKSEKGEKYFSEIKGQAKVVFEEMQNDKNPRLATDIAEKCGHKIVTRQDILRVVLYYIIVFKTKGFVNSFDSLENNGEILENETETATE
jgi:hypothetical protein